MKTKLLIIFMFIAAIAYTQEVQEWNVDISLNIELIAKESLSPEIMAMFVSTTKESPIYFGSRLRDEIRKWLESAPRTVYGAQIMNIFYIGQVNSKPGNVFDTIIFVDEWYNITSFMHITYDKK
jgi:hypothetical protein